jgi:hypothetical protein
VNVGSVAATWLFALLAAIVTPASAAGEDASANFIVRLFVTVCIPNVGQPERVRAWAAEQHLDALTSPIALNVFVGSGGNGAAWVVPSSAGSFALSIRGSTEACAVWAKAASPADVETLFRKIVEGAAGPGIDVSVVKDAADRSRYGTIHTLVYSISGADKQQGGFLYTMQTAEHPGGLFQVSLQAGRFTQR